MIAESVLQSIESTDALAPTTTAVVAVSGGCDSVALLHILRSLQTRTHLNLHVATLDHGIRGAAGQHDAELVRGLADRWQLPVTVERAEVPKLAVEWGIGLEAAARRSRYEFLARVAANQLSGVVIVGHHADDQIETVLLNIVRGSGARGLGGMRMLSPMPFQPEIVLFRPLLRFERRQLEDYCETHGLAYCEDDTNSDARFSRNYLRREVIPRLRQLNPNLTGAFRRLGDIVTSDEAFLSEWLEKQILPDIDRTDGAWRLGKGQLFSLHPALQRRLLRAAVQQLGEDSASLSFDITRDIIAWAKHAKAGAVRDLGFSLEFYLDYDDILIRQKGRPVSVSGYRLIPPGAVERITPSWPRARHGIFISLTDAASGQAKGATIILRSDAEVWLRTRRAGDRFKPKGMGGRSRKLKDWMIDRKIPRYLRDRIPLIDADGAIVAICVGKTWHIAESDLPVTGTPATVLHLV